MARWVLLSNNGGPVVDRATAEIKEENKRLKKENEKLKEQLALGRSAYVELEIQLHNAEHTVEVVDAENEKLAKDRDKWRQVAYKLSAELHKDEPCPMLVEKKGE